MGVASSTDAQAGSTGALDEFMHVVEQALSLPESPKSRWHRAGVKPRTERVLDVAGGLMLVTLVVGWAWSIATAASRAGDAHGPSATRSITTALTTTGGPTTAYLTDASLKALTGELRGASGKLRVQMTIAGDSLVADATPHGATLTVAESDAGGAAIAPRAGIWKLAVAVGKAIKPITDVSLISLRPRSEKQQGRIGGYLLGSWPGETGTVRAPKNAPAEKYRPPSGFIEVTQANADTRVSEHFRLRHFLTKNQPNVWPKYLVLDMRNIDKLELVLNDLASRGTDVSGVFVMSGFRTPQYNAGGGNTGGRAGLSRHMYGDAADIWIDSNHDGRMDDLNKDGRVDINDSRVILQALDRVEAAHPELVGGGGVYPATSGHGPFIHIDTRGYRARWIGSGGG